MVAAIGEGWRFRSARDFTAWGGMTPRETSSAGKRRIRGVSRQGESRLRKLFALGAVTLLRNARSRDDRATQWQRGILARRPMKVAVMAQAAKTAGQDRQDRLGGADLGPGVRARGGLSERRIPSSFDQIRSKAG